MSTISLTQKQKNKHLNLEHYSFIVDQVTKFNSKHSTKRNIGKTQFLKDLSVSVGTSLSNIYSILKDASVTVIDSQLREHSVLSAQAAYNRRTNFARSNNFKRYKAAAFIQLVESRVKANKLSSIDETIHHLILHEPQTIQGLPTICTRTFYTYVHNNLVDIKPIDLPRMVRRKKNKCWKTYIPKKQKGTSITERPKSIDSKEEFGHWEGDLVTGPRDGQKGAYLTLLERKTRFYLMLPIPRKSSKHVYMMINRLNRFYGDSFSNIFKSITFDNGSEFARWKDIEIKPGTRKQRTKVYFGRPYHSSDRAANENCNGLVRYFIKKGTDINTISKSMTRDINDKINQKKRKILGYLPAEKLFIEELIKINVTENTIFYKT